MPTGPGSMGSFWPTAVMTSSEHNPFESRTVFGVPALPPLCRAVAWLRARHTRIAAAICDAALPLEIDYTGPTAIVLGSEDKVDFALVRQKQNGFRFHRDRSSMRGIINSLQNVSNAAAVYFTTQFSVGSVLDSSEKIW